MRIIEITALDNGAHRNQTINRDIPIPAGWAFIPDDMEIPETFPFVNVYVSGDEVTRLSPAPVPPPEPEPEPEPEGDVWDDFAEAIRGGVNSVE